MARDPACSSAPLPPSYQRWPATPGFSDPPAVYTIHTLYSFHLPLLYQPATHTYVCPCGCGGSVTELDVLACGGIEQAIHATFEASRFRVVDKSTDVSDSVATDRSPCREQGAATGPSPRSDGREPAAGASPPVSSQSARRPVDDTR